MKIFTIIISVFQFVLVGSPIIKIIQAQDSLYLIGTITGESTEHKINYPVGIGDINGDGYDDFMLRMETGILSHDQAVIKLYLGSSDYDLNPDIIFHYPGNDNYNYLAEAFGIGDVNNDGYDDYIITGDFGDLTFPKGKAFLYYGGETIDTIPVAEFYQPNSIEDAFGTSFKLGDINNDGYDDFAVSSSYNFSDARGYVYLFWGGDTISWEGSTTLSSGIMDDYFGEAVANIGDINLDGFDDIAIGAPGGPSGYDTGKVFIYLGGYQVANTPDTILVTNNPGDYFAKVIKNIGNLNPDEITDFVITRYDEIAVYLERLGTPVILNGYSVDGGGDVNGDGYDDLLIGDDWKIKIYLGSGSFDTTYDLSIDDVDSIGFTLYNSIAGDINNDGYDEIFAFAPYSPEPDLGSLYIFSYIRPVKINDFWPQRSIKYQLSQNYPNPFNPSTVVDWQLENEGYISLKVYDLIGNELATLESGIKSAGKHKTVFDASKYNLSSGIYFCRLNIKGGESSTIKMVLVK